MAVYDNFLTIILAQLLWAHKAKSEEMKNEWHIKVWEGPNPLVPIKNSNKKKTISFYARNYSGGDTQNPGTFEKIRLNGL